ncbi:LMBR1-like protein [Chloropicon primus]|uniref:LMBR1-like protein n=1 Tax=Chloropicon primus TaxID=1764295 RepID=A0A5B8MYA8_9CHLO|nr:LMBR1-like protein [Chloropicon primus]UPR03582.1 LMBR1-like protein [Chloropicon primus]|eukprot:QDZ24374.1 LMBR1-like protein [Chloropicon primus]
MAEGYNWFLIIVTIVVGFLVVGANLHILVNFQHPEDRNQAWVPKIVVVFGLSLAMMSVLMFPLDVANRSACGDHLALSACNFAMPMKELWYTVYMTGSILVLFVIPFATFYYEADVEFSGVKKVKSALMWVMVTSVVAGLVLGLAYGLAGFVEYPVEQLFSGITPLNATGLLPTQCIRPSGSDWEDAPDGICDASTVGLETQTWTIRVSFPVYVIALSSLVGWFLFALFAGIGMVTLPIDSLLSFVRRPQATITKTQYMQRAKKLAIKAKEIKEVATDLRREEQTQGKSRQWRKKLKKVNQSLILLEEGHEKLNQVYPQGENAETAWIMTVLGYWMQLVLGFLTTILSLLLIVHIALYMLVDPPESAFLNDFFMELDKAFPLFGTAAFALFCFYLIAITVKGCAKFGLNLLIISVHPMKVGGTLMSSFLFNVALILLSTQAVIQFCAQAFAVYAESTEVQDIFGNEVEHLWGLSVLYIENVFIYAWLAFAGLTALFMAIRRPRKAAKA